MVSPQEILFIDIETAPQADRLEALDPTWQALWRQKVEALFRYKNEGAPSPTEHYPRAGIYAEFGKVICISVGFLHGKNGHEGLRLKTFAQPEEPALLEAFASLCRKVFENQAEQGASLKYLCAHNGKEFDFPYLARRMTVQQVALPVVLRQNGRKPWETPFLDTMEMWSFGDRKNYTSLDLLSAALSVPSPKEDINGGDVYRVYYEEGDLQRIADYCSRDVLSLVQVYRRLHGLPLLVEEQVEYV
jgi:hypothetical protein